MFSPVTHPRSLTWAEGPVALPHTSTQGKWIADIHHPAFYSLKLSDSQEELGTSRCGCECIREVEGRETWEENVGKPPWSHISRWSLVSFVNKQTLQGQLAGPLSFLWRWFIIHSTDTSWAPVISRAPSFKVFRIQRESVRYKRQVCLS